MPTAFDKYAIPLGPGVSRNGPTGETPNPTDMSGLLPVGARLYAASNYKDAEGTGFLGGQLAAYDHSGLGAIVLSAPSSVRPIVDGIPSASTVPVTLVPQDVARPNVSRFRVGFFEGIGVAGTSGVPTEDAFNAYAILNMKLNDGAGGLDLSTAATSQWSYTVDGTNAVTGELQASHSYYVTLVECIQTPRGLFAVRSKAFGVTTASDETTVRVTATTPASGDAGYRTILIYIGDAEASILQGVLAGRIDGPGTQTFDITALPLGETLPATTSLLLTAEFYGRSAIGHGVRMYAISNGHTNMKVRVGAATGNWLSLRELPPRAAIVYSDAGSSAINLCKPTGYFMPRLASSKRIVALASSPAGLLIFGDSETMLAIGDPEADDFRVVPISSTVGCDNNHIPARLGGLTFTVHNGRVHAVNLGYGPEGFQNQVTDISHPLWVPQSDSPEPTPAVRAVSAYADALKNQLLVFTYPRAQQSAEGTGDPDYWPVAYRFDVRSGAWLSDDMPDGEAYFYPIPTSSGLSILTDTRRYVSRELNAASFRIRWEDLDMGDRTVRKTFRRVHLFAHGIEPRGSAGSMTAAPKLVYSYWRLTTTTASDAPQFITGEIVGALVEPGHWTFTFPTGVVANRMSLMLTGWCEPDTTGRYGYLDSPVVVEFSGRYDQSLFQAEP